MSILNISCIYSLAILIPWSLTFNNIYSSNTFHLTPKPNIWGENSSWGVKEGHKNFIGHLLVRKKMYEARLRDLSIQRI